MKKTKLFLILILSLGFFLRVYKINSLPALNADEAAIGYNIYSLIQTGMDEHGNSWPIHFQSFNDYKPGGYFYIVLPFVKLFGLNIYSVRLPNVILSTLTILVTYLLVVELFKNKKLALVSSFLLAISPWHIHFSRGGWEASTATFFISLGFLLFIKAVDGFRWGFTLSALSFIYSLYTYHSARIVSPLLVLFLIIYYRKKIFKNTKAFLISGIISLLVLLPLAKDLTKPNAISRAAGVGLFADLGPINRINEQRGAYKNIEGLAPKLLHNKLVNYSLAFFENWTSHYHGEFLFISGDEIQRNKVPETGELYLFEILTVAVGLIMIAKKSKNWFPVIAWLLIAPIPAALTFQSPHALRAQNMVIPLEIISAYGLLTILSYFKKLKNKKLSKIYILMFKIFIFWNIARYLHMYYVHMNKEYPYSSQYGVKDLVSFVQKNYNSYDKIYITDKYDQPYILFLFYMEYTPSQFQNNHTLTPRDKFGFSTVRNFDKFYFEPINTKTLKSQNSKILIAGSSEEIPDKSIILKEIDFPNGSPAFKIISNK